MSVQSYSIRFQHSFPRIACCLHAACNSDCNFRENPTHPRSVSLRKQFIHAAERFQLNLIIQRSEYRLGGCCLGLQFAMFPSRSFLLSKCSPVLHSRNRIDCIYSASPTAFACSRLQEVLLFIIKHILYC